LIRISHFLRGNKGGELPHLAGWLDTETRERRVDRATVEHVLRFGWACIQRTTPGGKWTAPEWFRFTTPEDFWSQVFSYTRPKTRLYLFSHNLAFDAPVVDTFRILPASGWKLGHAVIESPPVILSWRRLDRTIVMLDTLNWWRTSLASLGDSIGIPKLKMPSGRASVKRWDVYCRNDVEIIRQALHKWWGFLARYDLGGFAQTLAGQAFRSYRHRFMDHKILIDSNPKALRLSRDSYMGGRTEAFHLGRIKGPVYCLDVNSMYPYVMQSREYPTVLRLYTRTATKADLRRWLSSKCVVAKCRLDAREPCYAVVRDGKLLFPVGRFEALLTTPDLFRALQSGELKECLEVAVYDKAPIFTRFVDELYNLRLDAQRQGNPVDSHLVKILMNSLYGKFGQRGGVWQKTGDTPDLSVKTWVDYDLESGETTTMRQLAGIVQRKETDGESYSSHPAIAAHVTAYARAYLWSMIVRAGRGNVVYCDTDSVWTNVAGYRRLLARVHKTELGALKLEHSYRWVLIHGVKDYETPDGIKCKGVSPSARWTQRNAVEQEQWSSLSGLVRGESLAAPRTTRVRKVLSRRYTKGTVSPDGSVSPIRLSDW
jgi:hypothetical protein